MRRLDRFTRARLLFGAVLLGAASLGCGGEPGNATTPKEGKDGKEEGVGPVDESKSHYPLIAGSQWVYDVVDVNEVRLREEVVNAKVDPEAQSQVQIILEDNEDKQGERTRSQIRRIKSGAFRVHKDILVKGKVQESVDYDPGFVRFDEAWLKLKVGESRDYAYKRASSLNSSPESRGHRYTLKGKKVRIKVPAGDFTCVHMTRERLTGASAGEIVEYWFAPGVGKVRERRVDSGKEERLKRFTLGTGDS